MRAAPQQPVERVRPREGSYLRRGTRLHGDDPCLRDRGRAVGTRDDSSCKFGFAIDPEHPADRGVDGTPENVKRAVDGSLRRLGIGLVTYSPLGRGFLTGQIRALADLPEDDWRRTNPRFQEQALQENLQLADRVTQLAEQRGVTPAQLALAWVLAEGEDIVPIPGTKSPGRLGENAAATETELSAEDIEELDNAISRDAVRGSRYPEEMMAQLNN